MMARKRVDAGSGGHLSATAEARAAETPDDVRRVLRPAAPLIWAARGAGGPDCRVSAWSRVRRSRRLQLRGCAEKQRGPTGARYRDYFLGYGAWWNDQINALVEKIDRQPAPERSAGTPAGGHGPATDLLILSDGIDFPVYLDLARQVCAGAARQDCGLSCAPTCWSARRSEPAMATRSRACLSIRIPTCTLRCGPPRPSSARYRRGCSKRRVCRTNCSCGDTAKARFGYPRHPFQSFSSSEMLLDLLEDPAAGAVVAGFPGGAVDQRLREENLARFLRGFGIAPAGKR